MQIYTVLTVSVLSVSGLFGVCTDCAFPAAIFPLLSSGWYYKPSPAESVILGLIVVKVLALRLASVTGILPIPYHINDLFLRSLGKRSVRVLRQNLTSPHQTHLYDNYESYYGENFNISRSKSDDIKKRPAIRQKELRIISRVLLGLRRIDMKSCFLKSLCSMSQRIYLGTTFSDEDFHIIHTLRYVAGMKKEFNETSDSTVMDIYDKAIAEGQTEKGDACNSIYSMCPLSDAELNYDSLLTEEAF